MLTEVEENKKYLFTLFDRTRDLLFTVALSGLEDVEFVAENGKVEVIEKEQEGDEIQSDNEYIGQTFGKLTAVKPTGRKVTRGREWLFQCSCGNTVEADLAYVKHGHKKSCGCARGENQIVDITGQKFGYLTAMKRLESKNKFGKYLWECSCDCGGTKTATANQLKSGHVKSCGCLLKELYEKLKLNIKGQKFGRLTAIEPIEKFNHAGLRWLFQCSCGNKTTAVVSDVTSGNIKSCGCLRREMAIKGFPDVQKHLIFAEGTHVNRLASDKINANNTSGYKGISKHKQLQKWAAEIVLRRKKYYFGVFDNIEDAARARKMAEEKLYKPIIEKHMGKGKESNSFPQNGEK